MDYFKALMVVVVLLLLTGMLCFVGTQVLYTNPLFGSVLFLLGVLAVVIAVDWMESKLLP